MKIRKYFVKLLTEGATALSTAREYFNAKLRELNEKKIQEQRAKAIQQQHQIIQANAARLADDLYEAFHDRNYYGAVIVRDVRNLQFHDFRMIKGKGVYLYTILKTQKGVLSPSELGALRRSMNDDLEWTRQNLSNSMSYNELCCFYPCYARGMQIINVKNSKDYFSVQIAVVVF